VIARIDQPAAQIREDQGVLFSDLSAARACATDVLKLRQQVVQAEAEAKRAGESVRESAVYEEWTEAKERLAELRRTYEDARTSLETGLHG